MDLVSAKTKTDEYGEKIFYKNIDIVPSVTEYCF